MSKLTDTGMCITREMLKRLLFCDSLLHHKHIYGILSRQPLMCCQAWRPCINKKDNVIVPNSSAPSEISVKNIIEFNINLPS